MTKIVEATTDHIPQVRELFLEYAKSLDFKLCFQGFDEELANLPGEYGRPSGCILLAVQDHDVLGCVALRPWSSDIAEMKRLYVRPQFQGKGAGRLLGEAVVAAARDIGYRSLRLDTVPSMAAAIHMYQSMGFYKIPPYRENPIEGTAYFEKTL